MVSRENLPTSEEGIAASFALPIFHRYRLMFPHLKHLFLFLMTMNGFYLLPGESPCRKIFSVFCFAGTRFPLKTHNVFLSLPVSFREWSGIGQHPAITVDPSRRGEVGQEGRGFLHDSLPLSVLLVWASTSWNVPAVLLKGKDHDYF